MKTNKSSGQASRLLLVLAVIVLVAVIITFLIMKMAEKPAAPVKQPVTTVPVPVYEASLGNIRFIFESAIDRGSLLKISDAANSQYAYGYQQNLSTTEKFIQVTIGAQNEGTQNIEQGAWDIGDIIDSQGRHFVPDDQYTVSPWLPIPNLCGALLKPSFQPTTCTKIYEVSKKSTGLQITVKTGKDNTANNLSSGKTDSTVIDLIIK